MARKTSVSTTCRRAWPGRRTTSHGSGSEGWRASKLLVGEQSSLEICVVGICSAIILLTRCRSSTWLCVPRESHALVVHRPCVVPLHNRYRSPVDVLHSLVYVVLLFPVSHHHLLYSLNALWPGVVRASWFTRNTGHTRSASCLFA